MLWQKVRTAVRTVENPRYFQMRVLSSSVTFAHFATMGQPVNSVSPRFTFPVPESVHQVFYNEAGPSPESLRLALNSNCEVLQDAIENEDVNTEFSPNSDPLDLMNQEALFFMKQTVGDKYEDLLSLLNGMLEQLGDETVKIRPPFEDHFTPIPLSEPPRSSGTIDSLSDNEHEGDSVTDGPEDGTG